jgi:hypothetical protein
LLGRQEIVIKPIGSLSLSGRASAARRSIPKAASCLCSTARLLSGGEKAVAPLTCQTAATGVAADTPFEEAPAQSTVDKRFC